MANENKKIYNLDKPISILVIGKKGRGKTNLIRHLLLKNTIHNHHFKCGVVFTNTKFDKEYDYLPDKVVIQGWKIPKFLEYLEYLELLKEEYGDEMPPNFMILDDLVGKIHDQEDFINFVCNIRHFNCTLIMSAQYIKKGVVTSLRENSDLVFMFNTSHKLTLEAMYEAFGGELMDNFKDFKKMFQRVTEEDYSTLLYIDKEKKVENCFKKYIAPDMSKIKIKIEF